MARTDPAGAARELRAGAAKLVAAAEALEQRAAEMTRSVGGSGDRVQISVVGPDPKDGGNVVVKQSVDTGEVT